LWCHSVSSASVEVKTSRRPTIARLLNRVCVDWAEHVFTNVIESDHELPEDVLVHAFSCRFEFKQASQQFELVLVVERCDPPIGGGSCRMVEVSAGVCQQGLSQCPDIVCSKIACLNPVITGSEPDYSDLGDDLMRKKQAIVR